MEDRIADIPAPLPWELLFPKQIQLFNMGIESDASNLHPDCPTVVICDGPRKSTKTIGVINRVLRHLWETPGARAALFVKITKSATDGGVWNDVVGSEVGPGEIQRWIDGVDGFEFTTFDKEGTPGPKTDSKTRTIYFRIRNCFGGESELRLFSLEHEHEVESRVKSTRFSLIWFSELSLFKDKYVFKCSWEQLRMRHLKPWQHMWIADTNPADDGEDSWIYQMIYCRKLEASGLTGEGAEQYAKSIRRLTFTLEDNLAMTPVQRDIQRANYIDDPGELARNVDGLWVKGHGNRGKHFADLFIRNTHVIGESEDEIEISKSTIKLFTGWDIGGGANHGCGIIEKLTVPTPAKGPDGGTFMVDVVTYNVLKSIKYVNDHKSVAELGVEMLGLMRDIEKTYQRKFEWVHYADDSALTVWRASSASYDYQEILAATDGEIMLTGVPKPAGSIKTRVRITRQLLRQIRLFIAGCCPDVIAMLENCSAGTTGSEYVVNNEWKHTFDWMSYVLMMEMIEDMELEMAKFGNKPSSKSSGGTSIG